AGCSEALARGAAARADRHRMAAVDEALAPLDEALTAASDRGEGVAAAPDLLDQVRRVWVWSGEDEGVERFAVERASSIAWDADHAPRRSARVADRGRSVARRVRGPVRAVPRVPGRSGAGARARDGDPGA